MKSRGNPSGSRFFVSLFQVVINMRSFYHTADTTTNTTTIIFYTDRHCRKMAYPIFVASHLPLWGLGLAPSWFSVCTSACSLPIQEKIGFHMRHIKVELSRDCYQGRCNRLVPSSSQGVCSDSMSFLQVTRINLLFSIRRPSFLV